jgi:hypothetical protein
VVFRIKDMVPLKHVESIDAVQPPHTYHFHTTGGQVVAEGFCRGCPREQILIQYLSAAIVFLL